MKVVIAGGGVSGLTALNCLEKAGIDATLYEKKDTLTEKGSGLLLGINVLKIMRELGLEPALLQRGQVLDSINMADPGGRVLAGNNTAAIRSESSYPTVAISRPELHRLLAAECSSRNIVSGVAVTGLEQSGGQLSIELSSGERVECDLLIGADGINSTIRRAIGYDIPLRYSGYTCWRFLINRPATIDERQGVELVGTGRRFGIFPVGDNQLYCYATLNASAGYYREHPQSKSQFSQLYSEFGPMVQGCLQALQEQESAELIQRDIFDLRRAVLSRRGYPVLLCGDAGHATTPNLGQGAAMGIEDSYLIARLLKKGLTPTELVIRFNELRIRRVEKIRRQSLLIGKVGQLENKLLCSVRNLIMRSLPADVSKRSFIKLLLDPSVFE